MTIYEEEHTLTMSVVGVSGMTYTATDVSVDLGFIERTALLRDACSALAEFTMMHSELMRLLWPKTISI
ncbi:Uncharacterised protein [Pluralibacter gergoviae]|nr:Uncharacterised protein [Pluralibacter gergoviae]